MTPILVFDIETIPDCDGIRRIHGLPAELSDRDVAEVAFQKRRVQSNGASDFLPPHLQRVVVISCVLSNDDGLRIFSLGEPEVGEGAAIQRFFDGINKYAPQLVSWNGRSFDLPVLLTAASSTASPRRASGTPATTTANSVQQLHQPLPRPPLRPHGCAVDLQRARRAARRARAPRGLPGQARHGRRRGVGGYLGGGIEAIRNYCEADTVNTYLLYLRFQLMRCTYTQERYESELALLRGTLDKRTEAALAGVPVALEGVTLRIESLDAEGRGVARNPEGKVVFVEGALPGEEVDFQVLRKKTSFEIGRAHQGRGRLLQPPDRRAARTSACAEAAACSTPMRARRWPRSSAGSRKTWRASARCSPKSCCRSCTARTGTTGAARGWARAMCPRKAARWWASARSARATSPTCASATSCRGGSAISSHRCARWWRRSPSRRACRRSRWRWATTTPSS